MARFSWPVLAVLGVFLLVACEPPLSLQEFRDVKGWVRVQGIVIEDAPNVVYYGGDSVQLNVVVSPANASDPSVRWSVESGYYANVSSTGVLTGTYAYSSSSYSVVVTATAVDNPSLTSSVTVLVKDGHLQGLSLGEGNLKMNVDSPPVTLPVSAVPDVVPLPALTWESRTPAVATVDQAGVITPLSLGTSVITVSGGGVSQSKTLTVVGQGVVSRVTVTPSLELKIGDLAELQKTATATAWPEGTSDPTITWSSEEPSVARVDANGKVTAVRAGTATIYARSHADSEVFATCEVTVGIAASPVVPFALPMTKVVDMVYSRPLDRVIILQNSPARLTLYDPTNNQSVYRNLAQVPLGLGLSPNGARVVVGFDGAVELFDATLSGFSEPVHWDVSTNGHGGENYGNLTSVSLTDGGMIYAIDGSDQWINLRRINGATGAESLLDTGLVRAGERGNVHPGNQSYYYWEYGDLHVVDVSNSTASTVPYFVKYLSNAGSRFWFFDHGNALLTNSGTILKVTQSSATDLTTLAQLSGSGLVSADHSSAATLGGSSGILATVANSYYWNPFPSIVSWYDDETYELVRTAVLPGYSSNGPKYWTGQFAFWDAAGEHLYVFMNKTQSSEDVWALATF